MTDELLNSLAVPTGEAGWPEVNDLLFHMNCWVPVEESDENSFRIECCDLHYYDDWVDDKWGIDRMAIDFPRHVPVMKLFKELVEAREYIKQIAPIAHAHGFEYQKK